MSPFSKPMLVAVVAAAFAAALTVSAIAGGPPRAHSTVHAVVGSSAQTAKLQIQMKDPKNGKWDFRVQLVKAPAAIAPELFVDDGTGTSTFADVGALTAKDATSHTYRLRLRGKDGDTLPAGAAALSDDFGRAFEVRVGAEAIVVGNLPAPKVKHHGHP